MENSLCKVFEYANNGITFKKENGVLMVNATEMAKPFDKRTRDFLLNRQTASLIDCVSADAGIPVSDLIIVNKGGTLQETW